jgi:hypothetical protein
MTLPSGDLTLVYQWNFKATIRSNRHRECVLKSEWSIEQIVVGTVVGDPDRCRTYRKSAQSVPCRADRRIVDAKFLRVPEVDASLISYLDLDPEIREKSARTLYDRVFGFPGHIRVEIKQVVVLDIPSRTAAAPNIPNRLQQASGCKPAFRQAEIRHAMEDFAIVGIKKNVSKKLLCRAVRPEFWQPFTYQRKQGQGFIHFLILLVQEKRTARL